MSTLNMNMKAVNDRKKKNFKCNVCGYEFSLGKYLINHMRTHTGERPFKCTVDDCGKAFKQESGLNEHVKFKHSSERPFKCNFPGCLHTAKTSPDLTKHKRVHSVERPFACSNSGCSFRAKSKSHVTHHVKSVHSKNKPFACTKCDFRTALSCTLKLHIRRHSARKYFKCDHPQCGKSFKSSSGLRRHFSNRHGAKNIICDHPGCGRKCASTDALNAHRRVVHSKKSRTCPNPDCMYSTNKASNLARHIIVHEGRNKNISCLIEGCEYKGMNSLAMEKHMRRHDTHLSTPVSNCGRRATTKEASTDHRKLHNSLGRPFQCPLCFKHFNSLDVLQQHCVVHTKEKPFQCGHCEFEAARQSGVKAHISSVHGGIQFQYIVHLLDDRECLHCNVILPSAEFRVHCKGHKGLVII